MTRTLCLIPGDGIGREVIAAARDVLDALRLDVSITEGDAGFDLFRRTGEALPEETLALAAASDAVLFGAVGSPSTRTPGYRSPIVAMRRELDLFACVRPVRSLPGADRPVDLVVVRENTEGMYSGRERRVDDRAELVRVISEPATARVARFAARFVRRHGRRRVTVVHKANVMRETCGLFREVALRELAEAGVEADERLVDAAAYELAARPERFDVVLTSNLFGDVLSDLVAVHAGGLGLVPSANLGERHAVFEPVHGSAPDIAGRGVCNPIATLRALAMALSHLDEADVARRLEDAIEHVLTEGPRTSDLGGAARTDDVTAAICDGVGESVASST